MSETFNEGLGHGGFVANITNGAGGTNIVGAIFNPFNVEPETNVVKFLDQIGAATKKAGIRTDYNGSATVQIPLDGSNNPLIIYEGATFTDPNYGFTWWISAAPAAFESGQVWKQNIQFTKKLN